MTSLRKVVRRGGGSLGEVAPIAICALERIRAEATEQHIVWRGIFAMQLKTIALEQLHLDLLALDRLRELIAIG